MVVSEPLITDNIQTQIPTKAEIQNDLSSQSTKVSAYSLASIKAKKELQEASKLFVKNPEHLPTQKFTETEFLLYWTKYAQRMGEKGMRIMESILSMSDPKVNGEFITLELPSEGSKYEFEKEKTALLGYLKGHLHNHNITIEVVVDEKISKKRMMTSQDRYSRLLEINPTIEKFRSTFGLEF